MISYSNPRLEAIISDWPIGSQRTIATFRIEGTKGRERGTRFTIHPKTGKPCATKKLTYAVQARIVDGDDGKTYIAERSCYGHVTVMQGNMQYQAETVHADDPRYDDMLRLFA